MKIFWNGQTKQCLLDSQFVGVLFFTNVEMTSNLSPLSCSQTDSISSTHGETCFLVWVKNRHFTWIEHIGWLNCLPIYFWFCSFEGCTAANKDALSLSPSLPSSFVGMENIIKRTYPYKEVLPWELCAVHLLDIYYNYLWLH